MSPFKIILSVIALVSIILFLFCIRLVLMHKRKIEGTYKAVNPVKDRN
jgi:hypothetical protein